MNICFVVTSPMTATCFLSGVMRELGKHNPVTIVTNLSRFRNWSLDGDIETVHIPIQRQIAPFHDVAGLIALTRLFRAKRFDLVHSVTPKAGLLAMTAARLAGIPDRFHTYTGQVWSTKRSGLRVVLKWSDKLVFRLATEVLVDSPSQKDFLIAEGVIDSSRSTVLGEGSISGVDTERFRPDNKARSQVRKELQIPDSAFTFLFLGRLKAEKGLIELIQAFRRIAGEVENTRLLLVGPDEEKIVVRLRTGEFGNSTGIIWRGYTTRPESYMAAADLLCLPSHREGFGSVIIEAAAVGIPSVGSDIYGIQDAIVDGKTGLLHRRGDVEGLYSCLKRLTTSPEINRELGHQARARAINSFSKERIIGEWLSFYARNSTSFGR